MTFDEMTQIDVNKKVEKKNKLTYLSWAWAWDTFKKNYPETTYSIKHWDGAPYYYDENLGYMVETEVTANLQTLSMWLPVMDGANKSMKKESYTYTTKFGEKTCEAASMFDINKTIMRCLTKNLAMFGLGLYIYAGEDLPSLPHGQYFSEHRQGTFKDALYKSMDPQKYLATCRKQLGPDFEKDVVIQEIIKEYWSSVDPDVKE